MGFESMTSAIPVRALLTELTGQLGAPTWLVKLG